MPLACSSSVPPLAALPPCFLHQWVGANSCRERIAPPMSMLTEYRFPLMFGTLESRLRVARIHRSARRWKRNLGVPNEALRQPASAEPAPCPDLPRGEGDDGAERPGGSPGSRAEERGLP